ncbi:hypothetical protein DY000_02060926 [Brassica cretica]|uniref:Uncharacterized protein n=1 Tax=Brassica cretica TaxID=69181 RepID=A0ABQ7AX08_BRACR|nr:hypothetical protein DY000_02060926 [Brassica cretica]
MKRVRYGLQETASKGRRECMDLCRIDVTEELGRYGTVTRSLRSDRATFFGLFSDVSCFFRRAIQKSRARFIALPVAKSRSKVFDFLKNCGVCIGVGHRRSGGWSFLTSVVANCDFLFRISRHCFDQAFCGYELE